MDTLITAPAEPHHNPPPRGRRLVASVLTATLLSSGLVGLMASAAHADTQTITTEDGAVLTVPTDVEHGEDIVISGENWYGQDGETPSVAAVLLNDRGTTTTREVINPDDGRELQAGGIYGVVEAEDDGTFEVTLPFPDDTNSNVTEGQWEAGSEQQIRLLSGSLREGDTVRNPSATFTITEGDEDDDTSDEDLSVVHPQEPTREGNTVTVPAVEGVIYSHEGEVEIPEGEILEITAEASEGHVLAEDASTSWSFAYEAPSEDDEDVEDVEEPTRVYNDGAEVWVPEDWEYGERLNIRGENWLNSPGEAGSVIAVRIDGDGGPEPLIPADHDQAEDLGLWDVIYADEDGNFDVNLEFPTPYNSDLEEPLQPGEEHDIILLTGSLGEDDIARGGAAGTVTITGEAPDLIDSELDYDVDRLPTGVSNGYQLTLDDVNRTVYLTDTQWRQETLTGSGDVAVQESTSKLVEFDVETRDLVRNHDFTGLTLNTGLGTDATAFDWSQAATDQTSYSTMRSHFGPYGVAIDTSSDTLITTTARQRNDYADFNYGGGVVLYSADQGAPTDGDRIWAYENDEPVFDGPRRIAVNSETNRAYVTNLGEGRSGTSGPEARNGYVTVLDTTKRGLEAVVAQVPLPKTADEVAVGVLDVEVDEDNNLVYVGTIGAGSGSLWVLDAATVEESDPLSTSKADSQSANSAVATELSAQIGLNSRPTYDPEEQRIYASAFNDQTITVVDADPSSGSYGETIEVIETGATNSVAVDGERGLLYSANLGDREVVVYDTEDFEPQLVLPTSGNAINVGIDPVSRDLWVSNFSSAGIVDVFTITGDDFDGGQPVNPPTPVDPDEPVDPDPTPTETPDPTDAPTDDASPSPSDDPTPSPSDAPSTPSDEDDDDPSPSATPTDADDDSTGVVEVTLGANTVAAGDDLDVDASGVEEGEEVTIAINPDLATVTADAEGTISTTVTVPADLDPGDYELTVTGLTSGAEGSAEITVTAADGAASSEDPAGGSAESSTPGGDLARTGATVAGIGLVALVLVALGAGALVFMRREKPEA